MHISIEVGELRAALSRTSGAAGKASTMPILSAVLLTAQQTPEGGRLTVRAYDLEVEVTSDHVCEVVTAGVVAVPAKLLGDLVKSLPVGVVELRHVGNRVEMTAGASVFRLANLAADDFPAPPPAPTAAKWDLSHRDAILAGLERVTYAMSGDETRASLCGVFVQPVRKSLALVCTDGHRLAMAKLPDVPDYGLSRDGAIVGRKAADELQKLLSDVASDAGDLAFTESTLRYRRSGLTYSARLIDGAFPAWQEVVPDRKSGTGTLTIDGAALQSVLRRVLLLAADRAAAVSLTLSEGELKLSARNPETGDAADRIAVEYSGPTIELAVNGRYLAEVVAIEGAAQLEVWVEDDTSPVMLAPVGVAGVRHVLMPMRR